MLFGGFDFEQTDRQTDERTDICTSRVAVATEKIQNINLEITLLAIGTGCGKCGILRIYCGILEYIFIIFIVSTEVFQKYFKPVAIRSHHIPDSKYGGIYRDIYIVYIGNISSSHRHKLQCTVGNSQ